MSTTWDGLPIAEDPPHGSTVVVRRFVDQGNEPELLLLHRAHEGPDYAGDWAWTSPAGARHPGEPVLTGALRELAEEAGITGRTPVAIDVHGDWALWVLDVEPDIAIELVDPEHDRFVWLPASEAVALVAPQVVSDGLARAGALPRGAGVAAGLLRG